MKRLILLLIVMLTTAACASFSGSETLGQSKDNLHCLEYKQDMPWDEIKDSFGSPETAPMPESGSDLSQNARIYKGTSVIFYTKLQKIAQDGKIRFREVVYKIEVCK